MQYKRILLKLSGEAMSSTKDCIDFSMVSSIALQVKELCGMGIQVGLVLGGGNIWRGRSSGEMNRNRADHMGMLATVINSLAMQDELEKRGVPCVVLSAVDIQRFCDTFTFRAAEAALNEGKVVIFACGTGSPFFSTDTTAALRAAEIGADALFLAKNIDGIYSADPNTDKTAIKYSALTYDEVITKNLRAMDLTAITICKEIGIPILAFSMKEEGNIVKIAKGGQAGTVIS